MVTNLSTTTCGNHAARVQHAESEATEHTGCAKTYPYNLLLITDRRTVGL